jgi:pimeloyl-ACP methyl ester carboxylesterase
VDYQGAAIELAVTRQGASDDLLLFLHGFGCTKESFDQAFDIAELGPFSLCSFDFPGHGQSGRTQSSAYSLQSYAEITNLLVDHISPSQVFMVGHSMGGAVALIATQGREDTSCLVSVDGNLVAQDCGIVSRSTAAQAEEEFISTGYAEFRADLQKSLHRDQRAWARWYAQAEPLALHESASSLVKWSDSGKLVEFFNALDRKAYIYGDREHKGYLLPHLDDAEVRQIKNAGHFAMIDNPSGFYSALSDILLSARYRSCAASR